jgi:hypothetical protein
MLGKPERFEDISAVHLVVIVVFFFVILIVNGRDAILTPVLVLVDDFSLGVYARASFGDRFISVLIVLIGIRFLEPHQRVEIEEAVAGFGFFTSAALGYRIADVEGGSEFDAVFVARDGRD